MITYVVEEYRFCTMDENRLENFDMFYHNIAMQNQSIVGLPVSLFLIIWVVILLAVGIVVLVALLIPYIIERSTRRHPNVLIPLDHISHQEYEALNNILEPDFDHRTFNENDQVVFSEIAIPSQTGQSEVCVF
ncbi:hypothetical protein RF11_10271 [Thelohanellus kitauei]|uniref:Uncharacterized protein n=1 Tax=Thelohanellus kitauei TaxID=669202 RepID=A0A0C2MXZ1_THEKT|nr:hypothetical protein RF11_10271 [Thelohanellus kitauei]